MDAIESIRQRVSAEPEIRQPITATLSLLLTAYTASITGWEPENTELQNSFSSICIVAGVALATEFPDVGELILKTIAEIPDLGASGKQVIEMGMAVGASFSHKPYDG